MDLNIDMPTVIECSVSECAYNSETHHAKAITIGNGIQPDCDTFLDGGAGHTQRNGTAGVGACKVTGCRKNSDLECAAAASRVGVMQQSANCMTYESRATR